jgi:hypothetical protein
MNRKWMAIVSIIAALIAASVSSHAGAAEIIRPGTNYSVARQQLLSRGFVGLKFPRQRCLDNVSARTTICDAYPETSFCAGTDLANCQFAYQDNDGAILLVETEGEEHNNPGHDIGLDLGVKRARPARPAERAELQSFIVSKSPGQASSYDDCRTSVAQHSFMLEARKQCRFRLREGTPDLAYTCTNQLTEAHRHLAISSGQEMWKKYRAR